MTTTTTTTTFGLGEAGDLKTLLAVPLAERTPAINKQIRWLQRKYKRADPASKKQAEQLLGIPVGKSYRTAAKHMRGGGTSKCPPGYRKIRKVSALHREVMKSAQVDIQNGMSPRNALKSAWAKAKQRA